MKRRRSDEDNFVCWHAGRGQEPADVLQVFWVLLQRDVLLRVLIWRGKSLLVPVLLIWSFWLYKTTQLKLNLFFKWGRTFQRRVVGSEEHSDSRDVWRVLAANEARKNNLGPSGVVAGQSSVHNVTFSEEVKLRSIKDVILCTFSFPIFF